MFAQWNIKPWAVMILGCMVFLMLLIVILPDVDLPDAAFHRGTGPTAIHAQANAAPPLLIVAAVHLIVPTLQVYPPFYQPGALIKIPDPGSLPILLQTFRC
jgi:hypothetical protein